ncbi:hypothetical protein [Streptomyces sp. NPDC002779]
MTMLLMPPAPPATTTAVTPSPGRVLIFGELAARWAAARRMVPVSADRE